VKNDLSYELVSKLFSYCPETGHVTWLLSPANSTPAGQRAGCIGRAGYRFILIAGKLYREHRIAWLLATGANAAHEVDHANGDRADNRWANLRGATHAENMQNMRRLKRPEPWPQGVSLHKASGLWRARITANREEHNLGYFHSPEAAHKAYLEAKARLHTFAPTLREAA
jgi:hypothetical protein